MFFFRIKDISKPDSHKSYRPLTVLTFRVNFWLHRLIFDHPTDGYRRMLMQLHFTNVLLHAIVSCQVYLLCRGPFLKLNRAAAIVGSLMFATHPIHTEAISGLGTPFHRFLCAARN